MDFLKGGIYNRVSLRQKNYKFESFVGKGMHIETIVLSEVTQTQKLNTLIWLLYVKKYILK